MKFQGQRSERGYCKGFQVEHASRKRHRSRASDPRGDTASSASARQQDQRGQVPGPAIREGILQETLALECVSGCCAVPGPAIREGILQVLIPVPYTVRREVPGPAI